MLRSRCAIRVSSGSARRRQQAADGKDQPGRRAFILTEEGIIPDGVLVPP